MAMIAMIKHLAILNVFLCRLCMPIVDAAYSKPYMAEFFIQADLLADQEISVKSLQAQVR